MKESSFLPPPKEAVLQHDPFFAEIALHGKETIFDKPFQKPTVLVSEALVNNPHLPVLCTFDFHDTLVAGGHSDTLTGEVGKRFRNATEIFENSIPNKVHFAFNTGSLTPFATDLDIPQLRANGLIMSDHGLTLGTNVKRIRSWASIFTRLKEHYAETQPFDYRLNLHERNHPGISSRPAEAIAADIESLVLPEEADDVMVLVDGRKERVIVRSSFTKEEGGRVHAAYLGYDPDKMLYIHFGDFINDVPVGISDPDKYFFVCSDFNRPFVKERAAIVSPEPAEVFVPNELLRIADQAS